MAGLFSRLSQRVLAPQGTVQPAAVHRASELAPATDPMHDTGMPESFAPPISAPMRMQPKMQVAPLPEHVARARESAGSPASVAAESSEVEESAGTPAPRSTPVVPDTARLVEPGIEIADCTPHRPATPAEMSAGPMRAIARAAQEIVPAVAASLPARRARRDAPGARAHEIAAGSPAIHVTIDRIDVHPPPMPAPAPRAPAVQGPRISLADYLSAGRRRP
jgi:hypothetical protein